MAAPGAPSPPGLCSRFPFASPALPLRPGPGGCGPCPASGGCGGCGAEAGARPAPGWAPLPEREPRVCPSGCSRGCGQVSAPPGWLRGQAARFGGCVGGVKSRCVLVWPNPRRSNTRRQPENWHGWLCKLVPAADIGVIPSDTAGCGLTSSPIWTSTQLPCYLPTAERHGRCFWEHISSSTLHLCPSQLRMHRLFLTVYPTAEARAPIRLLQAFKKKKQLKTAWKVGVFLWGKG